MVLTNRIIFPRINFSFSSAYISRNFSSLSHLTSTHTHTHTNTHKRILMGNRRKMALWGIVMRTMQTGGETIRWPRGESALPHKTIVCISFSIAFARWRYQFPHRDTQRQQWLPNHQSDRRRFVDTVLGSGGWASPVFADCVVGVLGGN